MIAFEHDVIDELGLHARPASHLVRLAASFKSKLTITKNGKSADVKKMFSVMGLAVKKGDKIEIAAEGEDEKDAIEAVKALFEREKL